MRAISCPIPVEELREFYHAQKLTDQQIVDRIGLGATVKRVRSWRRRYGIETIQRTERHEVSEISGTLRSLLIGSMLGDGRLSRGTHASRFSENHAAYQSEYAEWKRQQWGAWIKHQLKPVVWKKENKDYPGVRFETVSHASLNEWQAMFYPFGKGYKRFPCEVIPLVDPLAFAIWYMDDGCACWWPVLTLATASMPVAREVLDRFSIAGRWVFVNRGVTTGQLILEGEDNAHRFIDLVRPHIPECMSYKLEFGFQGEHYQVRQRANEQALEELAQKGMPIARIARQLGVSANTVDRYLRGFGIDHPRRIGRPPAMF